MRYVGGLARTCVIDLYAGVSTTPVEMLVKDDQPDFSRLQFPPFGGVAVDIGGPRE